MPIFSSPCSSRNSCKICAWTETSSAVVGSSAINNSGRVNSATVKQRVMAARERQFKRQNKLNAWLDSPEIRQFCKLESEDAMWLEGTLIHLGLSIRAWQRLLKVARTIADIDQSDIITRQHLQEAVSYRAIDRLLIHLQKLLT